MHCRIKELAGTLNSQYNAAAELRRNLEAEAALHTNKVSSLQASPFASAHAHCCKASALDLLHPVIGMCLLDALLENSSWHMPAAAAACIDELASNKLLNT